MSSCTCSQCNSSIEDGEVEAAYSYLYRVANNDVVDLVRKHEYRQGRRDAHSEILKLINKEE